MSAILPIPAAVAHDESTLILPRPKSISPNGRTLREQFPSSPNPSGAVKSQLTGIGKAVEHSGGVVGHNQAAVRPYRDSKRIKLAGDCGTLTIAKNKPHTMRSRGVGRTHCVWLQCAGSGGDPCIPICSDAPAIERVRLFLGGIRGRAKEQAHSRLSWQLRRVK